MQLSLTDAHGMITATTQMRVAGEITPHAAAHNPRKQSYIFSRAVLRSLGA